MEDKFKHYLTGANNSIGVSFGVLIFLTRGIPISIIIFSSELLIQYGLLGQIGFILAIMMAFIGFSFVANTIKKNFKNNATIGDVISARTSGATTKVMLGIMFVLSIGMLLIHSFSVHLMLQMLFDVPFYISQVVFYLFCFVYAGLGGMKRILKVEPLFVIVIFSAIILIPVYFFIQQGISPVYNGIWLYHPYLLYWKNYDSIFFVVTSFLLIFSMLMVDRVSWQRLFLIQSDKVRAALSLAGVIIGTILLALLSMILISLSGEGYNNPATVLFNMLTQLQTPPLVGLFITFCLVISSAAIGAELHAVTSFFVKNIFDETKKTTKLSKIQLSYLLSGFIIFLLLIAGFYSPVSIINSLFLYGLVCTSMFFPMLLIIYGKAFVHSLYIYGVLISIFSGLILFFAKGHFIGIWTTFTVSTCITFILYTHQSMQNKNHSSKT
ncbi:hypothetical protein [Virgibacillus sp. L01]|uniref:hypothetical protein n=1 Tax=Virgibacillus sp. L01 TaxID=3457429 RepID=UPI003FD4D1E0